MKRNIFLFTGFGFLGLNLIRILKKKFDIKIFGRKINFPFKLKLPKNKINFITCDFLDIKKLHKYRQVSQPKTCVLSKETCILWFF